MLAHLSSTFDPAGWISPIQLPAKRAQAQIWAEFPGRWDDPIPQELVELYIKQVEPLENEIFCFPRRALAFATLDEGNSQLHIFSDACLEGLGFAAYIRHEGPPGIEVALLFARSLVVPTTLKPKKKKDGTTRP